MKTLEILRPDDWHVHLRDGEALQRTVVDIEKHFGRALLMPNLRPPVRSVDEQAQYHQRVSAHLDQETSFTPFYALYLTSQTTPDDVDDAASASNVLAYKLYPQGATTHSDEGVHDVTALDDVFDAMAKKNIPLCIHAEVTDDDVDIFDREQVFLERILEPLLARHPKLRCVVEHLTTRAGISFVKQYAPSRVCASVTVHHLFLNRNDLLVGGIRPHHFCLPVAKREQDRKALLEAVTSNDAHFFFGSDSAPHARASKENDCGCAGIYTAPVALPLLAEAFDHVDKLPALEKFCSRFGARFYEQPMATSNIELQRSPSDEGHSLPLDDNDDVVLFRGGRSTWSVAS